MGRGEVAGEIAEKIAGDEPFPLGVLSQVQDDRESGTTRNRQARLSISSSNVKEGPTCQSHNTTSTDRSERSILHPATRKFGENGYYGIPIVWLLLNRTPNICFF